MSQENVEVVRAWLDTWVVWFNSPQDPDRLARLASKYLAEDVTYEEDPVWPDAGTYQGLDAVVRRFADYVDLVHIEGVEAGEAIDAGDVVIARVRIAMLGADAGEAVEFLWTYTLRVENGRIMHFRAWYDPQQALKAAGLSEQAVSQGNVEMARRAIEALNGDRVDAVVDLCDPEVEWIAIPGFLPDAQDFHGHAGVRAWFEKVGEILGDAHWQAQDITDAGDRLYVALKLNALGRASGIPAEMTIFEAWTVRNAKLVRLESYLSREAALEAAGLRE